jgi:hypothetical protein
MKISWDSPMRRFYYKGAADSNGVTTQFKGLADYISVSIFYYFIILTFSKEDNYFNRCCLFSGIQPFNSIVT